MGSDDDEDAPTKVQQTRKQFALGATVQDLRQVLDRLTPAEEETTSTPKMHDLGAMLKEVQEERLRELRSRYRKVTLRSGLKPPEEADPPVEVNGSPAALEARPRPPSQTGRSKGGGSPWPWVVAALGFGGVLVWLGTMINRPLPAPAPDHVHVTWEVSSKGAAVTIGGASQPSRGSGRFPCTGAVEVVVERSGRTPESHTIPCGGELVMRLEEAPAR